jgi:predicted TIM-barrel fold metal-dependent hydrolase
MVPEGGVLTDLISGTPAGASAVKETPYTVISCDTHAGPSLERSLRSYCPEKYLPDFDAYAAAQREMMGVEYLFGDPEKYSYTETCEGHDDPAARLRDMDRDGIAAAVIFGGGQNHQAVPFLGLGFDAGSAATSRELRAVGERIWNEWLTDYVAACPGRFLGVMQAPLWDAVNAAKEIEQFHDRGLKAVNFPSPRADFAAYNDPGYEPVWRVCEERGIPLVNHSGGGEKSLGMQGPGGIAIAASETMWLCRRALPQLIFGGVFERHPGLKVVFTEQRVAWVPFTLNEYDSLYYADLQNDAWRDGWPKLPSEYFQEHCYVGGSFLASFEVALRHEIGVSRLLWGDDYPHVEGSFPYTSASLRAAFSDVPEDEVRLILGDNALEVYDLDRNALAEVAGRVGPLPSDISVPLDPADVPPHPGLAFRTRGPYS